jgi:hypothetical protein
MYGGFLLFRLIFLLFSFIYSCETNRKHNMNLNETQMTLSEEQIGWGEVTKDYKVRNHINKDGVFKFSEWFIKNK